jgi:two-component system, probable response regulator PhcQ
VATTRILLVDDEPHVTAALKRTLRRSLGAAVAIECFDDPALALCRAGELAFDVVITDYRMPGMTGIEFLRALRSVQPHAVRMMLTATGDFDVVQRAVNEIEVFRFLAKPWNEDELIAQVAQALARTQAARQERELADAMRAQKDQLSSQELERRRLEALEPGLTHVEWGPNGEVLMPDLDTPWPDETNTGRPR